MFVSSNNSTSMLDCLKHLESIDVITNGNFEKLTKNTEKFTQIYAKIENLFENSRIMPAFGVSLHNETLQELTDGNWIQLNFSKEMQNNELPFNSLLFKLEETYGFNLIRLYNNHYEGRCIFLDLDEEVDLNSIID